MAKQKKSWKDIFADTENFGDDFTVLLKDKSGAEHSYTMGELRTANEESNGELLAGITKREKEIASRARTLDEAQQTFGEIVSQFEEVAGGSVASIAAKLKAGKTITKKEVASAAGLDESDPLVGDVVKQMNSMKGELSGSVETVKGELGKVITLLGKVGSVAMNDHYERRFEKAVNGLGVKLDAKQMKDLTLEKAMEYAKANKIVDPKTDLLDLDRAVRDMAAPFVTEATIEARVNARLKEKEDERALAALPRPTNAGSRVAKPPIEGYDPAKSDDPLGDAFSAAMQDEDLWRSLGYLGQQGGNA